MSNSESKWCEDFVNTDKYLKGLSDWHKKLILRYARMYARSTEYPMGRGLAVALRKYNARYMYERIPSVLINYLYTY